MPACTTRTHRMPFGVTLFGEDATYQFARVIGSSADRIAQAVISAYAATIAPASLEQDPSRLTLIEQNLALAQLMPAFMTAFGQGGRVVKLIGDEIMFTGRT